MQLVEAVQYTLEGRDLIPYGVIRTFHRYNPSGHTMELGSIQPLIEISTMNISWGIKTAGG